MASEIFYAFCPENIPIMPLSLFVSSLYPSCPKFFLLGESPVAIIGHPAYLFGVWIPAY